MVESKEIILPAFEKGFHLITDIILQNINLPDNGLLNVFIKHTSAGITINENADYSVRTDFETFFNDLIPEDYKKFTHIFEGNDDMPAHIKSSVIGTNITIPVVNGKLNLGTWQGIYLCEFRNNGGQRKIILSVYS
jgi:secondary thiamine-phosphate synthase enzyme